VHKHKEIKDTLDWAKTRNFAHDEKLVGVVKSLESHNIIKTVVIEHPCLALTDEAEDICKNGSSEARVWAAVPATGTIPKATLDANLGNIAKVGFGVANKNQWICVVNKTDVQRKAATIVDTVKEQLLAIKQHPENINDPNAAQLKGRKLIKQQVLKSFKVIEGAAFTLTPKEEKTDLTAEMIAKGTWEGAPFKVYNFKALGVQPEGGHLHPLMKMRTLYRRLLLEMGFEEMPTNNFVESSFWNFDALFQPQQHPARDMHDTFFLKAPESCNTLPSDYVARVQQVHEVGGFGSLGYRYNWKLDEAKKNIMRTHTTAVSSRMLYKLAQDFKKTGVFTPKKYFSIDRVYRNEALDATHLAEFHQIEGLIADRNLSLCDLLGVISEFYHKLGMSDVKFKPAYNPYTEPSMEIFAYHPGLKRLVEVGNSGVFRPEMLLPMGLPSDVSVIAWGLSLERPTMIKYNFKKIKKLEGNDVSLEFINNDPLCRLD
jgi:phenylalanyl-tRNA synthetase alpha chain